VEKKRTWTTNYQIGIVVLLSLFLAVCSCAGTGKTQVVQAEETAASTSGEQGEPLPVYYDFKDVPVPPELSLDKKRSFVYSNADITAGVLVLEGRMARETLVGFFLDHMNRNGWLLRSSFRYNRTILNFEKGQRSCLIFITGGSAGKSKVEIWLAPQLASSAS